MLPGLTKSYPVTPSRLRLTYEDVWLRSSDGVRLHAWFIKLFPDCRERYTNYHKRYFQSRSLLLVDFMFVKNVTNFCFCTTENAEENF
ncbi:hypothetical protein ACSBR1_008786 [Camellia fascicularis]